MLVGIVIFNQGNYRLQCQIWRLIDIQLRCRASQKFTIAQMSQREDLRTQLHGLTYPVIVKMRDSKKQK